MQTILILLLVIVLVALILKIRETVRLKKLVKQKDKEYSLLNSEYHDTKDTLITIRRNHVSLYDSLQDKYEADKVSLRDKYEADKVSLLNANIAKSNYLKFLLVNCHKIFNNLGNYIIYTNEIGRPKNIWLTYSKESKTYRVTEAFGKEDISTAIIFHTDNEDLRQIIEKGIIGTYDVEETNRLLETVDFDSVRNSLMKGSQGE